MVYIQDDNMHRFQRRHGVNRSRTPSPPRFYKSNRRNRSYSITMFYEQIECIEYDEFDQPKIQPAFIMRPDIEEDISELINQNIKHMCVRCYLLEEEEEEENQDICLCGGYYDYLKRSNDPHSYIGKMARTLNRDAGLYHDQYEKWVEELQYVEDIAYFSEEPRIEEPRIEEPRIEWRRSYENEISRLKKEAIHVHSPLPTVLNDIIATYLC
jgi:hypothetical protein